MTPHRDRSILYALGAAALFGASTPFAKRLVGDVAPVLLAGFLYLGGGIGLLAARLVRDRGWKPTGLAARERRWFFAAILCGGVLAPVLLLLGLARTDGSTASLLLNLESVLTALLAWLVFRENAGRRVVLGMAAIVTGGLVLSWPSAGRPEAAAGPFAIALACLCWSADNNLTRRVSGGDALAIAGIKGLAAGAVNASLGLALGGAWPRPPLLLATLGVGLAGYGVSLVLFVLALRGLGAARTAAYFSTAPFIGAAMSLGVLGERPTPALAAAAVLMGFGVWLHLTERHAHEHTHEPIEHDHRHVHDEHHGHSHEFDWDGREPHAHPHRHGAVTHSHAHAPHIHHRHAH